MAVGVAMLVVAVFTGASTGQIPLRPEPDALEAAPPALMERLRASPYAYFRFVNRPWLARVCQVIASETPAMPLTLLHGDANLEQYAVTKDAGAR